ncbi:T9SS type A sorting domain-containing protein [Gaetbulibacter saemankumensis]|uniref:T9SS type A sorting domain-containing protein n=1 Tax=Gaetbulibacter saemankumensis TaxID=311208 RepID=UPI000422BB0C|nr:T9SS type A sorting domain-containing protein [Gaetbulibacter saemankumensis]
MKKTTLLLCSFLWLVSYILTAQNTGNSPCDVIDFLTVDNNSCVEQVFSFDDSEIDENILSDPNCNFRTNLEDRWFKFQMPADGAVRIKTSYVSGSNVTDTAIETFRVTNTNDPCNNLESTSCDNDGNPATDTNNQYHSQIDVVEPAGSTIYFRVWENDTDEIGNFNICLYKIEAPMVADNDECLDVNTILPLNTTCIKTLGTNFLATPSSDDIGGTGCAANDGDDVWYKISVNSDKFYDIIIETSEDPGSPFDDTAIAVYSGSCNALVNIACDDDGGTDFFSKLTLTNRKDETLYIRVYPAVEPQVGTFNICAIATEALSADDHGIKNNFTLYPNPANDIIYLKFNQPSNKSINTHIYDIQGKLILHTTKTIINNEIELNVSMLKTGMYFLKIDDGENQSTKKIVII